MAQIIQIKSENNLVEDLFDEWNAHKRRLTFQRFISERMPLFFGPLSSNIPLFDKIKNAERQLDIRFQITKADTYWSGSIFYSGQEYKCPNFALEDDLRLFIILLHLKLKVTKKPA